MDSYLNYFFTGVLYQVLSIVSTFTGLVWSPGSLIGSVVVGRRRYASCNAIFRMGCNHRVIYVGWCLSGRITANCSFLYDVKSLFLLAILALGSFVYLLRAQQKIVDNEFIKLVVITIPLWILMLGYHYGGFAMGRILTLASKHAFFTRTRWFSPDGQSVHSLIVTGSLAFPC